MKPTLRQLSLVTALTMGFVFAQDPAPPIAPPADAEVKAPAPLDPAVEAWIAKVLGPKIADSNETIRQSAQQGLVTVGKPAVPYLTTLANGKDEVVSAEAKKVIARIERQGNRQRTGAETGNVMDRVMKDLGLNAEQETKVKEVMDQNRTKMQEIFSQRADGSLTQEEVRAAMEDLRNETSKQLKGSLNEEQFKKYEEATKNLRGAGGASGRRRRGGDG